ncbi:hypothetical protein VTN49DRAFT_1042 [Thermomyces lanuginosus]|uniref:uncharacterized protein n=1 Tax=Thermomyces lanuginosus TaxID=5541 RepID=UPI003742E49B
MFDTHRSKQQKQSQRVRELGKKHSSSQQQNTFPFPPFYINFFVFLLFLVNLLHDRDEKQKQTSKQPSLPEPKIPLFYNRQEVRQERASPAQEFNDPRGS